jgi:hypothetical protein
MLSRSARAQHGPLTAPTANPFPLSVSANGRCLVTAIGAPFLLVADSCQGGAIESVAGLYVLLPTARRRGLQLHPV